MKNPVFVTEEGYTVLSEQTDHKPEWCKGELIDHSLLEHELGRTSGTYAEIQALLLEFT